MPSQIIWVVVLILMLMMVFNTNPNTINMDGVKGRALSGAITASTDGLMLSRNSYQQLNSQTLPIDDWKIELRRNGVAIPKVSGFNFIYGATPGYGYYFCVTPSAGNTGASRFALNQAYDRMGYQVYLNETCGSTENAEPATPLSDLSNLALTVYTGD
jgi:hypothetical protein|tara:strand:+ start:9157 stop:9630 length:474 start_codon:yes stop_codon:yes gene_type:complete